MSQRDLELYWCSGKDSGQLSAQFKNSLTQVALPTSTYLFCIALLPCKLNCIWSWVNQRYLSFEASSTNRLKTGLNQPKLDLTVSIWTYTDHWLYPKGPACLFLQLTHNAFLDGLYWRHWGGPQGEHSVPPSVRFNCSESKSIYLQRHKDKEVDVLFCFVLFFWCVCVCVNAACCFVCFPFLKVFLLVSCCLNMFLIVCGI